MSRGIEPSISLFENDDGWWTARDEETGVASQGETREDALENLAEALRGFTGMGDPPTEADLREAGMDPGSNESGSLEDSEIFE
jgi:hypothetical protein